MPATTLMSSLIMRFMIVLLPKNQVFPSAARLPK
jgi:hypothetical protein